ncbi:hypothetical protein ACOMHN_027896 [Nucella lapillus]
MSNQKLLLFLLPCWSTAPCSLANYRPAASRPWPYTAHTLTGKLQAGSIQTIAVHCTHAHWQTTGRQHPDHGRTLHTRSLANYRPAASRPWPYTAHTLTGKLQAGSIQTMAVHCTHAHWQTTGRQHPDHGRTLHTRSLANYRPAASRPWPYTAHTLTGKLQAGSIQTMAVHCTHAHWQTTGRQHPDHGRTLHTHSLANYRPAASRPWPYTAHTLTGKQQAGSIQTIAVHCTHAHWQTTGRQHPDHGRTLHKCLLTGKLQAGSIQTMDVHCTHATGKLQAGSIQTMAVHCTNAY